MVNPYGQPDHKISVFLFTTPLSFQPILAGLLGLTMQSAMQSGSKWLHVPTLYSQLPSSTTVAKHTLLSKEFFLFEKHSGRLLLSTHTGLDAWAKNLYLYS